MEKQNAELLKKIYDLLNTVSIQQQRIQELEKSTRNLAKVTPEKPSSELSHGLLGFRLDRVETFIDDFKGGEDKRREDMETVVQRIGVSIADQLAQKKNRFFAQVAAKIGINFTTDLMTTGNDHEPEHEDDTNDEPLTDDEEDDEDELIPDEREKRQGETIKEKQPKVKRNEWLSIDSSKDKNESSILSVGDLGRVVSEKRTNEVAIGERELACLEPKSLLNDVLIDLFFKQIERSTETAYVISSLIYTNITNEPYGNI